MRPAGTEGPPDPGLAWLGRVAVRTAWPRMSLAGRGRSVTNDMSCWGSYRRRSETWGRQMPGSSLESSLPAGATSSGLGRSTSWQISSPLELPKRY